MREGRCDSYLQIQERMSLNNRLIIHVTTEGQSRKGWPSQCLDVIPEAVLIEEERHVN